MQVVQLEEAVRASRAALTQAEGRAQAELQACQQDLQVRLHSGSQNVSVIFGALCMGAGRAVGMPAGAAGERSLWCGLHPGSQNNGAQVVSRSWDGMQADLRACRILKCGSWSSKHAASRSCRKDEHGF